MNIPVVIICFNNYKYVEMMVKQVVEKNTHQPIIIINNKSDCVYTNDYLKLSPHKVINMSENKGHLVWTLSEIYDTLPEQFIITDPDIQFNSALPDNYIEQLVNLSHIYKPKKIGFALDISDSNEMLPYKFSDFGYSGITTIWESQTQYWKNKLENPTYELYLSDIDTTFTLYSKSYSGKDIRVAGNFTAKHLPWYKHDEGISLLSRYLMFHNASSASSIKGFTLKYINDNYILVHKRGIPILFEKNVNDHFWKDIYALWENDTFEIFDKYLRKDKQFLDIGAWMGTTCLYASRNSSYVVAVECDKVSVEKLRNNIKLNEINTMIDIESCAVYSSTTEIAFGPNSSSHTSALNDSMSQIKQSPTEKDYLIQTITLDAIIKKYNLNNLSLIKVDIEGGEENILYDLYNYGKSTNVPLYISFHYSWWLNRNLDRFIFLTPSQKTTIQNDPFCSILFEF